MSSYLKAVPGLLAALLVAAVLAGRADAWSPELTNETSVNKLCTLEPEAQCSWAVKIGLDAPGVDMHDASMASMRLDRANLKGANLARVILQLSSLEAANLQGANLQRAHMHGVNLQGANLAQANLFGVNLLDADLRNANLQDAILIGAILTEARLDNAVWIDGRVCAEGSVGECR